MDDCNQCGHCCVICTDAQLTKQEAKENLYAMQPRNGKGKLDDWSNKILMRSRIFDSELRREIYACVYWNPAIRKCLIYEDRPDVCRQFDCKGILAQMTTDVRKYWRELKAGNNEFLCLNK